MKKQEQIDKLEYKVEALLSFIEINMGEPTRNMIEQSVEKDWYDEKTNERVKYQTMEEYEAYLNGQEW